MIYLRKPVTGICGVRATKLLNSQKKTNLVINLVANTPVTGIAIYSDPCITQVNYFLTQ